MPLPETDYYDDLVPEEQSVSPDQPSAKVHQPPGDGLDHIRDLVYNRKECFEEAVSLGLQYGTQLDHYRWKSAELAYLVTVRYGEGTIKKYARRINKSPRAVTEWRQVWAYWHEMFANFREEELLTYTHFRLAMNVGVNQSNPMEAIQFLNDCLEHDWHTGDAEIEAKLRMGKTVGPEKLGECAATILNINDDGTKALMQFTDVLLLQQLQNAMREKRRVTIKVYELDPPKEPKPHTAKP